MLQLPEVNPLARKLELVVVLLLLLVGVHCLLLINIIGMVLRLRLHLLLLRLLLLRRRHELSPRPLIHQLLIVNLVNDILWRLLHKLMLLVVHISWLIIILRVHLGLASALLHLLRANLLRLYMDCLHLMHLVAHDLIWITICNQLGSLHVSHLLLLWSLWIDWHLAVAVLQLLVDCLRLRHWANLLISWATHGRWIGHLNTELLQLLLLQWHWSRHTLVCKLGLTSLDWILDSLLRGRLRFIECALVHGLPVMADLLLLLLWLLISCLVLIRRPGCYGRGRGFYGGGMWLWVRRLGREWRALLN